MSDHPVAAGSVPATKGTTVYPAPFAALVRGRLKQKLGDAFGLRNFGVNLTTLDPGAISALFHYHTRQDEFVYVLEGRPTLVFGEREYELGPGDCMGFRAGTGIGHQLVNRSAAIVRYLEIGDRSPDDGGGYPKDDLAFQRTADGNVIFVRRDGSPY